MISAISDPAAFAGWRKANLPFRAAANTTAPQNYAVSGGSFGSTITADDAAMLVDTAAACVRVLANQLGTLPIKVHKPAPDNGIATDHPLHRVLKFPNPEMTGVDAFRAMVANGVLHGRAYFRCVRTRAGEIAEIWPVPSLAVSRMRQNNQTVFRMFNASKGAYDEVGWHNMLEFRLGISFDGVNTTSTQRAISHVLDMLKWVTGFQESFLTQGGKPQILLEFSETVQGRPEEVQSKLNHLCQAIQSALQDSYARPVALPKGAKPHVMEFPMAHTQSIRDQLNLAICRHFGVPPHMVDIAVSEMKAGSMEEMNLQFMKQTLRPMAVIIEHTLGALLPYEQQGDYALKYNFGAFLQVSAASQAMVSASAIQNGIRTPAEIRDLYDLPFREDCPDTFLTPANMVQSGDGLSGVPGSQTTSMGGGAGNNRLSHLMFMPVHNRAGVFADGRGQVVLPDHTRRGQREAKDCCGKKALSTFEARAEELKSVKASANEFLLYGPIGDWVDYGEVPALQVLNWLSERKGQDVTIRVNSPGGDVFEGVAMYNALARHDGQVTIAIDGVAASAASFVAMAGGDIRMAENALLMVHKAWSVVYGNADDLAKESAVLATIDRSLAGMYARRSGLPEDEVMGMMSAETWMSAEQALEKGLVSSITPNVGPPATPVEPDPAEPAQTPEQVSARMSRTAEIMASLKKFRPTLPNT